MKKTTKIILLGVLAAVVIAVGVGAYFAAPFLAMRPVATGTVHDHYGDLPIIAVRNGMGAVFFMQQSGGTIMIDAGSDAEQLEKSMREEGILPEDVKWVLLTHSDYDHVAGLTLVPGADVFMSEDEVCHLDGTVPRKGVGNKLPEGINLEDILLLRDDQELLCAGTAIRCIKAPGHTAGSMAYLVGDVLFSGDAVRTNPRAEMRVHPFTQDKTRAEASVQRLKELPWTVMLTSHYGTCRAAEIIA